MFDECFKGVRVLDAGAAAIRIETPGGDPRGPVPRKGGAPCPAP